MTKDRDKISGTGFFELNSKEELGPDISERNMNILKEAQSIMMHIRLQGVKSIYKMKDTPIRLSASVFFDLQHYTFNGTTYRYGTYPTSTQLDNFIKDIKDYVLKTIQKATEA